MEPMGIDALVRAAGGTLAGPAAAPGGTVGPDVTVDSRAITPGAVFVALPGERVDGHDYVAKAAAAGAGAALVSRPVEADVPQVVCAEPLAGLAGLARAVVGREKQRGLVVVGITGSSGKTSTKDLLAGVLEAAGPTIAPPGSFNNEIGAPLTACRVDASTRFLVAEMGARGIGHIRHLASITPPTIGAVLNVGHAHLGEFGSVAGIAQAKGELVEALDADGWAVLNADDPRVLAMAERTRARVAVFSATTGDPGPRSDELRVWATDAAADAFERYAFTVHAAGAVEGRARVRLGVLGAHQVANALAAVTVGLAAGLELDAVAHALDGALPRSRWRMQLEQRPDGLAVLNDSYNANPDSMRAALGSVARLRRPGGRVVAALGDMLELGEASAEEHRMIGALAAELGVDELLAVGNHGPDVVSGFGSGAGVGRSFSDKDDLVAYLRGTLGAHDVVLVKASRGLALDTVADAVLGPDDEGAGA